MKIVKIPVQSYSNLELWNRHNKTMSEYKAIRYSPKVPETHLQVFTIKPYLSNEGLVEFMVYGSKESFGGKEVNQASSTNFGWLEYNEVSNGVVNKK